jgi:hypothetical protein
VHEKQPVAVPQTDGRTGEGQEFVRSARTGSPAVRSAGGSHPDPRRRNGQAPAVRSVFDAPGGAISLAHH